MTIRFSRDATADLQDISDYTFQQWGEEQETFYLKQIHARLKEIKKDAGRFRLRNELFDGCQVASVGRHLIVFLVKEDIIVVSRILHQSMDFPRHLFPNW